MSNKHPTTSGKQVDNSKRNQKILDLRMKNYSYPRIVKELKLDITPQRCNQLVSAYIKSNPVANFHDMRWEINGQFDRLVASVWDLAISGDDKAFEKVLQLLDRKCKLNGLYALAETESGSSGKSKSVQINLQVNNITKNPNDERSNGLDDVKVNVV